METLRTWVVVLCSALAMGAPAASADEIPTARPSKVGMSAERLARIAPVMQRFVDEKQVAGIATLIARDGRIVHDEQFGALDFESGRPLPPDAIYRIYSMSKPIAAVALMMLHEEGKFLLGDPASRFIPELAQMKVAAEVGPDGPRLEDPLHPITMREVLSHTAGFGYGIFADSAGPIESMYAQANLLDRQQTLAEMITKMVKLPLQYQPGTSWAYSLSNDVQGRLVEMISGQPFDAFLREQLFGPLDMPDTGFTVPPEAVDRFTSNYLIGGNSSADGGGEPPQPIDTPAKSSYVSGVRFFSGGGGLVSTTRDYLRFAQMLANGGELDGVRILSPRTIELMTLDHLPRGVEMQLGGRPMAGLGYGLGFGVYTDQATAGVSAPAGAYWWGGAANTGFWIDPQERIVGVLMTQRFPGSLPLNNLLQSLAYQAIVE